MTAQFGAHEMMEVHEVLNDTIDGINQFQLYRPHITCTQLQSIMDKQMQFMMQEYNSLVQALNQRGMSSPSTYRASMNQQPTYGLQNPQPQAPNASMQQMDNRDVASGMLGCHKASAMMRMISALECADPQIRKMIQQGANNCAEQAYEVWQYMNEKGYYQVPTMKEMTTNTMMNSYTTTQMQPQMMNQQMNQPINQYQQ